ncbi:hypothetical protein [Papillibacter cinnamivorans]|uniref:Uncharacterized protein n=1 Tax=Papillibacter cinnamivorans DSM 12816 TaxID=1122930 RepID=A0A1W1YF28_9FIRM|nr:hypothetical protein [Papillibacter cinnamivorans]SMC34739.1 hypothetical protein SAMN02745168_0389 [Papillibacter cinnamivorans DSM 12816]
MMDGINQGGIGASSESSGLEAQSSSRSENENSLTEDKNFALLLSALIQEKAASQLSSALSSDNADSGVFPSLQGSGISESDFTAFLTAMENGTLDRSELALMLLSGMTGASFGSGYSSASGLSSLSGLSVSSAGASAKSPVSSGSAVLPASSWMAAVPSVTGDESCRSPELLNAVLSQFQVETAERYRPHKNGSDTYCNIYVWDVTGAMGAEIPHYVDPETGAPREYPDVKGASELSANGISSWLTQYGSRYGWTEVDAKTAQEYANRGCPAVTAWKNESGGSGHVQVVCPSRDQSYAPELGVTVSQAGSSNLSYAYISSVYGAGRLSQVRYFVHE